MGKIKDRMSLGIISGLIASVPCTASLFILNRLKLTDYHYNYPASIFLHRSKTNTSEGKVVSVLVNTVTNCTMGVINTYVLSATGRDKAVLKGAGFSSLLWVVLNGFIYNNSLKIKSRKPYAPIYLWAIHALYGGLCAVRRIMRLYDFPTRR